MTDPSPQTALHALGKKLKLFFPEENYSMEQLEELVSCGEIFTEAKRILPYLQSALLEEQVLEIELDGMTRIYITRLSDALPALIEEIVDGEPILTEPPYTEGDYLKAMGYLVTLPLEPGMGNIHIKDSKKLVLRLFTRSGALEFGTFFQEMTLIRDIPLLKLAYPVVGRLIKGVRAYRAMLPAGLDAKIIISGAHGEKDLISRPLEISAHEVFFSIEKEEGPLFTPDEPRNIQIIIEEDQDVCISGSTLPVEKIRGRKGVEYRCGIYFDLQTRSLAAEIEAIVARVQRAYLKELVEKSEASGLNLPS
ncbi:MAG: hypothetical protein KKC77_18325 [Proteobacteria bacterium]|nr:hypothetical protein [Pseudomonadota bacterium]